MLCAFVFSVYRTHKILRIGLADCGILIFLRINCDIYDRGF